MAGNNSPIGVFDSGIGGLSDLGDAFGTATPCAKGAVVTIALTGSRHHGFEQWLLARRCHRIGYARQWLGATFTCRLPTNFRQYR